MLLCVCSVCSVCSIPYFVVGQGWWRAAEDTAPLRTVAIIVVILALGGIVHPELSASYPESAGPSRLVAVVLVVAAEEVDDRGG